MQQFNCFFCGPRDQSEFTYLREAATIPALDAGVAAWQKFVYERDNPCGAHAEWWQHNHGCRQVLEIMRHTQTHEVVGVHPARSAQGTP
ncbi:MAG: sarcosine oxidase subunit delta [Rhodoferax sp.]|nr:sarcosine oxidase subunit delta [Rhodoferax sp.]